MTSLPGSDGGRVRSCSVDVLQVVTTDLRRGAERFAVDLAVKLQKRGVAVRTVALVSGPGDVRLDLPTLGPTRLGIATLRALRHEMRDSAVVVAHGSSTLPATAIAGAGIRTPVIYRSIGEPRYWASSHGRRLRTRVLLTQMDHVVALTEGLGRQIVEMYGISPSRLTVIPRGAEAAHFAPPTAQERARARRSLGLDPHGEVVLYVGALSGEKNVGLAIDAVANLEGPVLVVVGEGPESEALRRTAAPHGHRVRFVGALADPRPAYRAADVLVLPSLTEGVPGVVIEAALMEIPAVGTRVGGVPDVIEHGRTGYLVETDDVVGFGDAVRSVLRERDDMGAAARRHCLRAFESEHVADLWARVVRRYLGAEHDDGRLGAGEARS